MIKTPDEAVSTSEGQQGSVSTGEQPRNGKRPWIYRLIRQILSWLIRGGFIAVFVSFLGLIPNYYSTFKPVNLQYNLALPEDPLNLLRNDHATIGVSAYNEATHESLDLKAYKCNNTSKMPPGVFVQKVRGQPCDFEVNNIFIRGPVSNWPVPGDFILEIHAPGKGKTVQQNNRIYLHDVSPPTIRSELFEYENGKLAVSADIDKGREKATVEHCVWSPPALFFHPDVYGDHCHATFKNPLPDDPAIRISVLVKFNLEGSPSFEGRSDEVAIHIPAKSAFNRGENDSGHSPLAGRQEQEVVKATPLPINNPKKLEPASKTEGRNATSITSEASVSDLILSLDSYRDSDRYDRLESGMKRLAATIRIEPSEAFDLLGPLTGSFRLSALSTFVLPRLRTPISSKEVAALFKGFPPQERADMLRTLAGCFQRPVDKDALLSGIFGADRNWVEPNLDSDEPCSVSQATRE